MQTGAAHNRPANWEILSIFPTTLHKFANKDSLSVFGDFSGIACERIIYAIVNVAYGVVLFSLFDFSTEVIAH